ncbi:helix-turn-helix transcriptional regulator [Oceanobacillus massiliensis]|uniref:helix-turn-helix transcriptional regulator n=1 Tax=Oceanobacillus massiliensis TaxID=1465765 RepID=UPI00301734E0
MNGEKRIERINKAIEDFGGLLHEYRVGHSLSLQDMSEIVGYSPSYIWRIEKYRRFPEMDTRLRMLLAIWSIEDIYLYLQEVVTRERKAN